VPAGIAGPAELTFDVRCFLVAHPAGLVLIDTGPAGSADAIGAALDRDRVRNLQVVQTPGHTAGHISLLHDDGCCWWGTRWEQRTVR
jgi:glyoxylase-like metal-dependent hydrolase (beta-lactamase superfamily II)